MKFIHRFVTGGIQGQMLVVKKLKLDGDLIFFLIMAAGFAILLLVRILFLK